MSRADPGPLSAKSIASHVNAIAPSARTRRTKGTFADTMAPPAAGFDAMDPANVSPVVAWRAGVDSSDVTGRVIDIVGGRTCVEEGRAHGLVLDVEKRWEAAEVGSSLRDLLRPARTPEPVCGAR